MDQQQLDSWQASCDRVAGEYTRRIADELQYKPLDRRWSIPATGPTSWRARIRAACSAA
jgi:hypothetical protein